MPQTRILVVDDHDSVRRYLCSLLETQPDFRVVSEATTGIQAVRDCGRLQPDIVLLDISLPELSGLQAIPRIRKLAPGTKILMVTNLSEPEFAEEAFRAGAHGFLSKIEIRRRLVSAVREVCAGKTNVGADPVYQFAGEGILAERVTLQR